MEWRFHHPWEQKWPGFLVHELSTNMALFRARLSGFLAGFAVASAASFYFLQRDLFASHKILVDTVSVQEIMQRVNISLFAVIDDPRDVKRRIAHHNDSHVLLFVVLSGGCLQLQCGCPTFKIRGHCCKCCRIGHCWACRGMRDVSGMNCLRNWMKDEDGAVLWIRCSDVVVWPARVYGLGLVFGVPTSL